MIGGTRGPMSGVGMKETGSKCVRSAGCSVISSINSANTSSDGELSISGSKTHQSLNITSLDRRTVPYVPLSLTLMITYVGTRRVV